ncbi:hypothetical protein Tco_0500809 [Tanacetum coccineum]
MAKISWVAWDMFSVQLNVGPWCLSFFAYRIVLLVEVGGVAILSGDGSLWLLLEFNLSRKMVFFVDSHSVSSSVMLAMVDVRMFSSM